MQTIDAAPKELALAPVTPMSLIQQASAAGASIEQMAQLFELKLRVDADEARKAFNEAFTAFKNEPIRVVRDKENTQYSKPGKPAMYTSLESMVATVTPFLSKHGLSHRWDIDQSAPGQIKVICVITHTLGHSHPTPISGPIDDSGAKNKLQGVKSTLTYLKVSTFESACGIASAFGSLNDDGNAASASAMAGMAEYTLVSHLDNIEGAATVAELQQVFGVAYKEAQGCKDQPSMGAILRAKDKRKKELAAVAA